MARLFRCPECRTRRRDYGLFTQHLRDTGHKLCHCGHVAYGGTAFPHRRGSPFCEHNSMAPAQLASRYGASDEEVAEIVLELSLSIKARPVAVCPF
ncbi:hypothetical protein [Variovorax sp. CY25R-8]|uniref:hypothetical protein n=1 Tax=Variovorax sp. CY25R-8 TaxID=2855501 RepID=UPI0021BAC4B5|nr:hypothetical protein [Variovorax sp. CY25R-8]MCT8174358.1 hypothetical protein [Variovorax sp. CY25R-8]